jgi:hypothetical protein
MDCVTLAATLCSRAGACAGDGTAPVVENAGGSSIIYESVVFCEGVFTQQCGPQAPAADYPLVRDPGACSAALATTSCMETAGGLRSGLLLPLPCQ